MERAAYTAILYRIFFKSILYKLYRLDRHHVVISHVFLYALFNYRIECRRQLAAYHLHIVRIYTAWDALVAQENHRF